MPLFQKALPNSPLRLPATDYNAMLAAAQALRSESNSIESSKSDSFDRLTMCKVQGRNSFIGNYITNVTNTTNPTITTDANHLLSPGQNIYISDVVGAAGVNGAWQVLATPSATTFTITAAAPGVYSAVGFPKIVEWYPRFAAVVLDHPLVLPTNNLPEFKRIIAFQGRSAKSTDISVTPNRIAILLEPIGPYSRDAAGNDIGRIGDAVLEGVVPCQINVNSSTDRFAKLKAGQSYLDSVSSNSGIEIVWILGTTGLVWGLVRLGSGLRSPLTTKGDLFTHDSTVDARLAVGSTGQFPIADPTQATGIRWGGWTLSTTAPGSGDTFHTNPDTTTLLVNQVSGLNMVSGTLYAQDASGAHAGVVNLFNQELGRGSKTVNGAVFAIHDSSNTIFIEPYNYLGYPGIELGAGGFNVYTRFPNSPSIETRVDTLSGINRIIMLEAGLTFNFTHSLITYGDGGILVSYQDGGMTLTTPVFSPLKNILVLTFGGTSTSSAFAIDTGTGIAIGADGTLADGSSVHGGIVSSISSGGMGGIANGTYP